MHHLMRDTEHFRMLEQGEKHISLTHFHRWVKIVELTSLLSVLLLHLVKGCYERHLSLLYTVQYCQSMQSE